jgi:hypothetical protein
VARAKGTDRAEARRRYRAIVKAQEEAEDGSEGQAVVVSTAAGRNRGRASQALKPLQPAPGQRLGLIGAAKAAYRPVHYREDLRYIVPLVTRTHAVWPVLVITMVAVPLALTRPTNATASSGDAVLGVLAFWLSPTPLVPAMFAGFFAPRASWLVGAIDGFIVGAGLIVFVILANGQLPAGDKIATDGILAATVQVMSLAIPMGAVIAAFTGWYKRFLTLSSGNGNRRKAK